MLYTRGVPVALGFSGERAVSNQRLLEVEAEGVGEGEGRGRGRGGEGEQEEQEQEEEAAAADGWSRESSVVAYRFTNIKIPVQNAMHTHYPVSSAFYLFLCDPLISMPTPTAAAAANPPTIATPISPSFATLSSINCLRLCACRFPPSNSSRLSLYLRASA